MFKNRETKMKEYWGTISHEEREKEKLWYAYQTNLNTKRSAYYLNAIGIIVLIIIFFRVYASLS